SQPPAECGPERARRGVLGDYHQMTLVDAVLAQCVEGACGERATDAASAMRALHSEVIHVAAAAVVSAEHGTDYAGLGHSDKARGRVSLEVLAERSRLVRIAEHDAIRRAPERECVGNVARLERANLDVGRRRALGLSSGHS